MGDARLLAGCLIASAVLGLSAGEAPPPRDPEAAARVKVLIGRLGDRDWRSREEAARHLEVIGEPAAEALREAERSGDEEVRARAREILRAVSGWPPGGAAVGGFCLTVRPRKSPCGHGEPLVLEATLENVSRREGRLRFGNSRRTENCWLFPERGDVPMGCARMFDGMEDAGREDPCFDLGPGEQRTFLLRFGPPQMKASARRGVRLSREGALPAGVHRLGVWLYVLNASDEGASPAVLEIRSNVVEIRVEEEPLRNPEGRDQPSEGGGKGGRESR